VPVGFFAASCYRHGLARSDMANTGPDISKPGRMSQLGHMRKSVDVLSSSAVSSRADISHQSCHV
jgi:hypothetical protein